MSLNDKKNTILAVFTAVLRFPCWITLRFLERQDKFILLLEINERKKLLLKSDAIYTLFIFDNTY